MKCDFRKRLAKKICRTEPEGVRIGELPASYTIEAALLLPVFLFAIMKGLLLGIECYEDVRAAAESSALLETIEPTDWIWKMQWVEKGVDLIYEHTIPEKSEK